MASRFRRFITRKVAKKRDPTSKGEVFVKKSEVESGQVDSSRAGVTTPTPTQTFVSGGSSGGGGGGTPPSRFNLSPQETQRQTEAFARSKTSGGVPLKEVFTSREKEALIKRAEIQKEAEARGKGFTRLNFQKKLGRGGTSALRSATRKSRQIFKKTGIKRKRIVEGLRPKKEPQAVLDPFNDNAFVPPSAVGDIFLKKSEAEERGVIFSEPTFGIPSIGQRSIEKAESFLGREKGSSGVISISSKDLGLKKSTTFDLFKSTSITGIEKFSKFEEKVPSILGKDAEFIKEVKQAETERFGRNLTRDLPVLVKIKEEVPKLGEFVGKGQAFSLPNVLFGKSKQSSIAGGIGGRTAAGVVAEFVPTSVGQASLLAGAIALPFAAAPIATTGVSGVFAVQGTRVAFNKDATITQRLAGGIVGIGGGLGVVGFGVPFAKGVKARLSSDFVKVQTAPEGFKFIEGITTDTVISPKIGLIKSGAGDISVNLPELSPLRRGGFDVKQSEKIHFLGKDQTVATSQIGLFGKKPVNIEREFFVTPQDPITGLPVTRASRLGLTDTFKAPEEVSIGFGFQGKPQIGIAKGIEVARTEKGGAFKIGTGTELEAIKTSGTITSEKIGTTIIKGQGVDIFEFKIGKVGKGKSSGKQTISTEGSTRISGEGLISSSLSQAVRTSIPKTFRTGTRTTTRGISTRISPFISPTISPTISPKISTTISPIISPPISFRFSTNRGSSRGSSAKISPIVPIGGSSRPRPPRSQRITRGRKIPSARFSVLERRRKKFKPIGSNLSLSQAINVGREKVSTGLGATFKIVQTRGGRTNGGVRTPFGFKQKKSQGLVFIEAPKFRLSRSKERRDIQIAKRRKRK